MSNHHDHDHDHEEKGIALRVKALEQLLIEKGVVNAQALDEFVDIYENRVGPRNGARVVAKAWVDQDFRKRLLEDGAAAASELGFSGIEGERLVAVENTDAVHMCGSTVLSCSGCFLRLCRIIELFTAADWQVLPEFTLLQKTPQSQFC